MEDSPSTVTSSGVYLNEVETRRFRQGIDTINSILSNPNQPKDDEMPGRFFAK